MAAFLAMCSGPSEPDENTPLNAEETEGLLRGMMVVFADTMPQISAIHSPTDFTILCPDGGDARVNVSNSDTSDGDTVRTAIGINFMPSGCGLRGTDGTDFVLEANPGLDYTLAISIVGFFDDFSIAGGLMGQLDWMVESRSGTCRIDMDLEAKLDLTSNPPGAKSYMTGDACEHELMLDVTEVVAPSGASQRKHQLRSSS